MPKYTLKASDGASYTLDSPNELTQDQLNTAFSEALQQSQTTQQQAPQQQQPAKEPRTTASGLLAAAGRGAAPYAAAATLGAVTAGPLGAAAAPTALLAADVLTPVANYALGTNYPSPSDSIQNLLTRAGTPQPKTETERVVQAASGGASGQKAFIGLGKTLKGSVNPLSQRVGQVLSESPLAQYFSDDVAVRTKAQGALALAIGLQTMAFFHVRDGNQEFIPCLIHHTENKTRTSNVYRFLVLIYE